VSASPILEWKPIYDPSVKVEVEGQMVKLISTVGVYWFIEWLDLVTGKQVKREDNKD
jgi:hypothetical protein